MTKTYTVTGGKGGTGKSTFAITLALKERLAGKNVLLVDCDVECPNDYLLLGVRELVNPKRKTYAYYPQIDEGKCQRCGLCVDKCKSSALFQTPGSAPHLNEDLCTSCGVCWTICPAGAISKREKQNGDIFENKIDSRLTLVTGRSLPGIRETSPVVERTRDYVKTISSSFDLIILDTAAGSHCTVITALEEADLAFAVTEPTPLGAHDLKVILEVLKVLEIPSEIVLNRSNVGDRECITEISDTSQVPINIEIPYSKRFAEIYSEGRLLENEAEIIRLFEYKNYE